MDGIFSAATDQRSDAGIDLRADRDRLHDGVRHHRHDQFRARRDLHDRRLYRGDDVSGSRPRRPDLCAAGAADRPARRDAVHRALWLGRRAHRLSAAARVVSAGAADLGDRHVDLSAELRADHAGRARQADAAADPWRVHDFRERRVRGAAELSAARDHGRDPGADDRLFGDDRDDPARPVAARLRAGHRDGLAARHRRRSGDLDDLCHGRGARRGRRADGHAVLRRRRFLHRVSRRREGVHRRRARRHRLAAGGDARRLADRADRGVLVGLFLGRVQGRVGFRRSSSWCWCSCRAGCSAGPRWKRSDGGRAGPARHRRPLAICPPGAGSNGRVCSRTRLSRR